MKISESEFNLLEYRAEVLKTMGHPLRLALLKLLQKKKEMTVTELFNALEVEQATVSHHLRLMRSAKIVDLTKSGKHSNYFIANKTITKILSNISELS